MTITSGRDLGTILGIWAHPDDESYLAAGLMAEAIEAGSRVTCVTATRGEKGSWDEERWPSATMGQVREAELMRCLDILGITEHHWLDYIDAEVEGVPFEEGVGRVLAFMDEVRPDSVLTFGPDGMTDHPDHKAVSAWTTEAFARAAKPGATLYYATQTPEWAARFVPILNEFDVFGPGTPPVTEEADLAIAFRPSGAALDRKLAAISEHVSQMEGMLKVYGPDLFKEAIGSEFFRLGARAH